MILDSRLFARMLRERVMERRIQAYELLASSLKRKDYYRVCGQVKECDALVALIDETVTAKFEDDYDPDPLTSKRVTDRA